jgi:hypothetical protein
MNELHRTWPSSTAAWTMGASCQKKMLRHISQCQAAEMLWCPEMRSRPQELRPRVATGPSPGTEVPGDDPPLVHLWKRFPNYYIIFTLWIFNIAMENDPFKDDFPKTSIFNEFFMAMLNNQREIYIYNII